MFKEPQPFLGAAEAGVETAEDIFSRHFSALYFLPLFFFPLPFSILIRAFAMEARFFAASEVICSCCLFPSPQIISRSVNRRCYGAEKIPPPRNGNGTASPFLCLQSTILSFFQQGLDLNWSSIYDSYHCDQTAECGSSWSSQYFAQV